MEIRLRKPELYERTTDLFWNDPYIAKQMLKAHLDPNTDAASRKPETIEKCADFIMTLPLPKNAAILDIGCGPGLYTKQFALRGLRVTGLDFSVNSIVYARQNDNNSEYVLGDYLELDYKNAFDIITLIYYDFGALIPAERHNLLSRVHRALKPGGLFFIDVYTPKHGEGRVESTRIEHNRAGGFWSELACTVQSAKYFYDDIAEACRYVVTDANGTRAYNIWDCYFTRKSLIHEVTQHEFSEFAIYSNVTGTPYEGESETMCAILRRD